MGFKSIASDTSAMLYQLSYEASLEAGQSVSSIYTH